MREVTSVSNQPPDQLEATSHTSSRHSPAHFHVVGRVRRENTVQFAHLVISAQKIEAITHQKEATRRKRVKIS